MFSLIFFQAEAISAIAKRLEESKGSDAASYELAAKYVESFSNLAQKGNTLILPGLMNNQLKDFYCESMT